MANVFAPNGFSPIGPVGAHGSNGGMRQYFINSSNTTAIYHGDIVALTSGYVVQATSASTPLGVFVGCEFQMSALNNQSRWSQMWPGSGAAASTSIVAYVVDDPDTLLIAQSGTGGPVTQASVGLGMNLNVGTGNALSGISGMFADFASVGTTTPQFTIVGLTQGNAGNGGDNTTAGNLVMLAFAKSQYAA